MQPQFEFKYGLFEPQKFWLKTLHSKEQDDRCNWDPVVDTFVTLYGPRHCYCGHCTSCPVYWTLYGESGRKNLTERESSMVSLAKSTTRCVPVECELLAIVSESNLFGSSALRFDRLPQVTLTCEATIQPLPSITLFLTVPLEFCWTNRKRVVTTQLFPSENRSPSFGSVLIQKFWMNYGPFLTFSVHCPLPLIFSRNTCRSGGSVVLSLIQQIKRMQSIGFGWLGPVLAIEYPTM